MQANKVPATLLDLITGHWPVCSTACWGSLCAAARLCPCLPRPESNNSNAMILVPCMQRVTVRVCLFSTILVVSKPGLVLGLQLWSFPCWWSKCYTFLETQAIGVGIVSGSRDDTTHMWNNLLRQEQGKGPSKKKKNKARGTTLVMHHEGSRRTREFLHCKKYHG